MAHCDIKPENILITEENNVRLADFGKCQPLVQEMVQHRAALGSPFYAAPEANRGQEWGSKYDMWSLACVIFESITKKSFARFEKLDVFPVQEQIERVTQEMVEEKLEKGMSMFPEFERLKKVLASILIVEPIFRPSAQEVRIKYQMEHNLGIAFELNAPPCIVPHIPTEAENAQHYKKRAVALQQQMDTLFYKAERDDMEKKKLVKECEALMVEVDKMKTSVSKKRAHGQLGESSNSFHQQDDTVDKNKQIKLSQASSSITQCITIDEEEEDEDEEDEGTKTITTAMQQKKKTPDSSESEDDVIDSDRASSVYSALVGGARYLFPGEQKRKTYKLKDLTLSENQKKFVELDKYLVKEGSPNEKARKEGLLCLREKTCSIAWRLVFSSMNGLVLTPEIMKFQAELMNVKKGNQTAIEEHLLCAVLVIGESLDNAKILYKLAGGKRKLPTVTSALVGLVEVAEQANEYRSTSCSMSPTPTSTTAVAPAPAQAAVSRLASMDPRVIAAAAARARSMNVHGVPHSAIAKQLASNAQK